MRRTPLMIPICLLLLLVSCATTAEKDAAHQKQAKATRDVGEAYMTDGQFTAALKELLAAEAVWPDDSDLQNDLGLTYMAKEKPEDAIRHFRKALELSPSFTAARNNMGAAYLARGEWKTAITIFDEVLTDLLYTTPHFPQANLGWAYYNLKEYAKAEEHYRKALEFQPRYVVALRGISKTHLAKKDYEQALRTLNQALDITPRFAPLYFDMADIYRSAGDARSSVEIYKKIIALYPNSPYASDAKFKAGELLLDSGGMVEPLRAPVFPIPASERREPEPIPASEPERTPVQPVPALAPVTPLPPPEELIPGEPLPVNAEPAVVPSLEPAPETDSAPEISPTPETPAVPAPESESEPSPAAVPAG